MKEYGTDLQKQYEELHKKQIALEQKIRKRAKLVLGKNTPVNSIAIRYLLTLMIRKEEQYAAQSKQLDLFKNQ
jgi:hypothetical protein